MKVEEFSKIVNGLNSDEELWQFFSFLQKELKKRGLIRSGNIVGDRGESIAIERYNRIAGLPNLQAAPRGTQNVDALSRKGERYSIKTITEPSSTTGVFHGVGNKEDKGNPEKKFEYVIIVQIDKGYMPKRIIELSWNQLLMFRKWHKTMRAWNLTITKELLKEARIIFENIK